MAREEAFLAFKIGLRFIVHLGKRISQREFRQQGFPVCDAQLLSLAILLPHGILLNVPESRVLIRDYTTQCASIRTVKKAALFMAVLNGSMNLYHTHELISNAPFKTTLFVPIEYCDSIIQKNEAMNIRDYHSIHTISNQIPSLQIIHIKSL